MCRIFAVGFLCVLCLVPAVAAAKCVSGQPVDYNDVDAVLFTTRYRVLDGALGSGFEHADASTIEGSRFWALFWNDGREVVARYSQFTLPGSIGTYDLAASLGEAVAILQGDRFFELAPQIDSTTDRTYSVITVRRCWVITRIIMANDDDENQDPATAKLFRDFWKLIENAKKKKISNDPMPFTLKLLFDQ